MIGCERKPLCLAATVVALLVAAAHGYMSGRTLALEQDPTANEGSGPAYIQIAKGKISSEFSNRPLFEVLDAIGSQIGFEYRGDKVDLNRPVSGRFKAVPLVKALEKILEPFNYIIVFNENGEIKRLHIVSLQRGVAYRDAAVARDPPHTSSLDDDLADAVTEYLGEFEPVVSENGPNDPDVGLQGLPEFEPVVSENGPNDPDVGVQGLPEEPVVSATDPNDPDVGVQSLPEFEPVVSENGPIDPNLAVEGLPEFEP